MAAVHAPRYSASAELIATGTGTVEFHSIIPPWKNALKPVVLRPESGQSCHDESENTTRSVGIIRFFLQIMLIGEEFMSV